MARAEFTNTGSLITSTTPSSGPKLCPSCWCSGRPGSGRLSLWSEEASICPASLTVAQAETAGIDFIAGVDLAIEAQYTFAGMLPDAYSFRALYRYKDSRRTNWNFVSIYDSRGSLFFSWSPRNPHKTSTKNSITILSSASLKLFGEEISRLASPFRLKLLGFRPSDWTTNNAWMNK